MEYPVICRYCGGVIRLVCAEDVYGRRTALRLGIEEEMIHQCQNCGARVGCHKGSTRPLGQVANEILRLKRMETHKVFDGFWRRRGMGRSDAYKWLAGQMGLPEKKTHIAGFEVDQCQRVIDLCRKYDNENLEVA